MKRKIRIGNKIAIIITMAAMCLSGCAEDGAVLEEETINQSDVPGMVKVESTVQDSKEEESESTSQEEVNTSLETIVQNQESSEEIANDSDIQVDFDVQNVLEEAESEASALQKKLLEDPSLTQADMNTLSSEIYQVWDGVLNDLWKTLKSTLDENTWNSLLEEQRVWITEKEAEVKQAGEEVGGGSLAPLVTNQRAAKLTRARVYELASYLGFEGTLITFTVEGMEEVVPATIYEGLHYTLSIPTEGWEMIASECWVSDVNGDVQFWVTDYAGEDIDSICKKLMDTGYETSEFDPYSLSREDEEGLVHFVRLFTENDETIGLFYCYPAEAAEGFGVRIPTIIDTFSWKSE